MKTKEPLYSGKAKSVYPTDDPSHFIVTFRDDVTAFDAKKHAAIPKKGYYNAQISARLFRLLEHNGVKTHFIEMVSDTEMLVHALDIIKIEVIARNIAAGSLVRKYPFKEGQILDPPIVVYHLKADKYGDPMVNTDLALALGLATAGELEEIRNTTLKINTILTKYFDEHDLLMPDAKFEFGRSKTGGIMLGDEISPDTCRLWDKNTRKSLDKDVFRFDKGDIATAYHEVARRIIPGIF